MDYFGKSDPRRVPRYFFFGAFDMDYDTAIPANVEAQDYTVCPRYWYIDAHFHCESCHKDYRWTATEQQTWFETYRFYVDSFPKQCIACRGEIRDALQLRQQYDAAVGPARAGGSLADKQHVVDLIDALEHHWTCVPDRIRATRDQFRRQLERQRELS